MNILVAIIVSLGLIFVHILGERIAKHIERFHVRVISFGAGLMVGTFFLEILPLLLVGETYLGKFVYWFFLVGFTFVHLLEIVVYNHSHNPSEIVRDTTLFEAAGLIVYDLLVGFVIVVLFETEGVFAYFIILSFFVRTFALSVFSKHINEKVDSLFNRFLQTIAPLIGVVFAFLLINSKIQLFLIFSLAMGIILYVIIRNMIPTGKKVHPTYFILGVVISLIISTFSDIIII